VERERVRVGVVGVGYLGAFHAEKYASMPGVELVSVADLDAERCKQVSHRHGVGACLHFRDLLGRVDAVSIAVPTPDHFFVAREFLTEGIDVLLEKPITRTLGEADELIRLAEGGGRIIQVGHLEQFNPAVTALKEVLTTPLFIESHRLGPFQERGTDVDVVLDLMIHDIDIILSCVRSELESIDAVGVAVISPHVDIANARLRFAGGCVANITASRISLKKMRKIRLFQPNAYLTVDYADRILTVVECTGGSAGPGARQIQARQEQFTQADPLEEELRSFVHCVRTRTSPLVDGKRGREALRVSLDILNQISLTLASMPLSELVVGETA